MKSKLWMAALLLLSAPAWAESPAEAELRSAQMAYQAALKSQTDSQERTTALQSRLQNAQTRLERTQAEIVRLQGELNQADVQRQQNDSALQTAGARLDAAWPAVRAGQ